MNIVRKDLDSNNAVITLNVEKADYAATVEKTLRDYRKKANIPGFRPGNVPFGIVQKMYGKAVLAEEINKLVSENLYDYIKTNDISILGEPLPNETEQKEIDFNTQENFEFVFDIGIAPEFDVELTKKDKVKFYKIDITDEMIDNQVKSYTGRYGKYVQEENVDPKDMLKGELLELENGKVKEDGIKITDAVLTPEYIKDKEEAKLFDEKKKGDVVVFNPAKGYQNESELASFLKMSKEEVKDITADFQFTIESITRYHEAEVNQELFDKIYGEGIVKSEEEFRSKIKENIEESLVADSNYKFGLDARDMLVEKYKTLIFPDAFLNRWLLASNENMTEEGLKENYPKIIADLTWQLIKDKLGKVNDLKVEPSDVEEQAKNIARAQFAQYRMVGLDESIIANYATEMMKKEDSLKSIIEKVAEEKILEIIKSSVKLDEKEISIDDFNKMFEVK